jgi:hypothetical protein
MTQATRNAARLARLLSIVLALDMFQNMVSPAVWILGASNSIVSRVSRLANYPDAVAYGWLVMAALMVPYMVAQTAGSNNRLCTRLACLSLCGGGSLWMFLAWLGRNLDYSSLVWLFGFNCFISIAMGAVLALSINDRQKLDVGAAP